MSARKLPSVIVELICEKGHKTITSLTPIIDLEIDPYAYTCVGGSDWDHCDECPDGWRDQESRDKGHHFFEQEMDRLYSNGFGLVAKE